MEWAAGLLASIIVGLVRWWWVRRDKNNEHEELHRLEATEAASRANLFRYHHADSAELPVAADAEPTPLPNRDPDITDEP